MVDTPQFQNVLSPSAERSIALDPSATTDKEFDLKKAYENGTLKITGSDPFGPGESCLQAIFNDESKFGGECPFWLKYEFKEPIFVEGYIIETANDEPGRDPKDWQILDEDGK